MFFEVPVHVHVVINRTEQNITNEMNIILLPLIDNTCQWMMVVLRTKWFKIFWRQCFWSYTCKCISQMLSILIIACYISDIDWLQHWCRCNIFRARLTLPQSMQAVDLPGQEVAVLTQGPISKNTHYGPFEAKKTTHEFSDDSLFLLKVVQQLMILELLVRLLMESFFNFLYFMPCSLSQ